MAETWQSSLLPPSRFQALQNDPVALVKEVEQIASHQLLAEKETWLINKDQEVHDLRQANASLSSKSTDLEAQMIHLQQALKEAPVANESAAKMQIQQKIRIAALELELETSKAQHRTSLFAVETKSSHIKLLEDQLQNFQNDNSSLRSKHADIQIYCSKLEREHQDVTVKCKKQVDEISSLQSTVVQMKLEMEQYKERTNQMNAKNEYQAITRRQEVEEVKTHQKQLQTLYENSKQRNLTIIEQNSTLLSQIDSLKEENTILTSNAAKDLRTSTQLIEFQQTARTEVTRLQAENAALNSKQLDYDRIMSELEARTLEVEKLRNAPSAAQILALDSSQAQTKSTVLLQLVANYEEKAKEAEAFKTKNERLSLVLGQINQSFHQKLPIFEQQRKEYMESQVKRAEIATFVEKSFAESEKWKTLSASHAKENRLLLMERDDLMHQVNVLLKENQRMVAILPSHSQKILKVNSSKLHPRNFRNIHELQEVNQHLSRQLNEEKIILEGLQEKIKEGSKELTFLRFEHAQMKSKLETSSIMNHATGNTSSPNGETAMKIESLQKKNVALQENIEKAQSEFIRQSNHIASLQSTASHHQKQQEAAEAMCISLQKEITGYQQAHQNAKQKCQQYQNEVERLSKINQESREEARAIGAEMENLKPKMSALEASNASLLQQISSLEHSKTVVEECINKFNLVSAGDKKVHQQLETMHQEERKHYAVELERITNQYHSEIERYRETISFKDSQLECANFETHKQKETIIKQGATISMHEETLKKATISMKELQERLESKENKMNLLIKQGFGFHPPTLLSNENDNIQPLQNTRIQELEQQVAVTEEAKEALTQSLQLCDEAHLKFEKGMNQQLIAYKQEVVKWEEKFDEKAREASAASERILVMQKALDCASDSSASSIDIEKRVQLLITEREELKKECDALTRQYDAAEAKYEFEMKVHREDMQQLDKYKSDHSQSSAEVIRVQKLFQDAENRIKTLEETLKNNNHHLEDQQSERERRIEDLQKQNSLLLTQLHFEQEYTTTDDMNDLEENSKENLCQIIRNISKERTQLQIELTNEKHKNRKLQELKNHLRANLDQFVNSPVANQASVTSQSPAAMDPVQATSIDPLHASNNFLRKQIKLLEAQVVTLQQELEKTNQFRADAPDSPLEQVAILEKQNKVLKQKNDHWALVVSKIRAPEVNQSVSAEKYEEMVRRVNRMSRITAKNEKIVQEYKKAIAKAKTENLELSRQIERLEAAERTPVFVDDLSDLGKTPEMCEDSVSEEEEVVEGGEAVEGTAAHGEEILEEVETPGNQDSTLLETATPITFVRIRPPPANDNNKNKRKRPAFESGQPKRKQQKTDQLQKLKGIVPPTRNTTK